MRGMKHKDISNGEQYVISKKKRKHFTKQSYVKQEDVELSNLLAEAHSSGPLRQHQPSVTLIPGKQSVIETELYTIRIAWQVPPNLPDDITYEVSYRSVYEREWTIYPCTPIKEPSVEIFWLNAETDYVFRVRAKSGRVFGDYSEVSEAIKINSCIIL